MFALLLIALQLTSVDEQKGQFELPPLPYSYNALEPYIDEETMHLHYDKHHKAYVDNLNVAITTTEWQQYTLRELFAKASKLPTKIRNNAGGHFNHTFYWEVMTGNKEMQAMPKQLKDALCNSFGSIEKFKQEFQKAGFERFGSGYAWLIKTKNGKLQICSTPNQDNPLMDDAEVQGQPLLVCDVWEHAYYLKYHNLRGSYLENFWNTVNWHKVDSLLFPNKDQGAS